VASRVTWRRLVSDRLMITKRRTHQSEISVTIIDPHHYARSTILNMKEATSWGNLSSHAMISRLAVSVLYARSA
jgi:hypothetical protein